MKIRDHRRTPEEFVSLLRTRVATLKEVPKTRSDFTQEMSRFLPAAVVRQTVDSAAYWTHLVQVVDEHSAKAAATAL